MDWAESMAANIKSRSGFTICLYQDQLLAVAQALRDVQRETAEEVFNAEESHYHEAPHDGTDICAACHRDLRDPVHLKWGETRAARVLHLRERFGLEEKHD